MLKSVSRALPQKEGLLAIFLILPMMFARSQNHNNKKIVKSFYDAIQLGNLERVSKLLDDDYIGHNANLDGTKNGILAVAKQNAENKQQSGKIHFARVFSERDLVVLHSKKEFGSNVMASFDLFKVKDGKILEHWDAYQKWEDNTANGNTQIDGPTAPKDLHLTQKNKAIVREFLQQPKGGPELYISKENYIQHSPFTENGLDGMLRAFEKFEKEGIGFELIRIHHLLGEGNFVVVHTEGKVGEKPSIFFDIFRLENKKIVEHWDVVDTLPDEIINPNGAF